MTIVEIDVLRWLHIIAMVYWLGGEWGVFQTSYNVINRKLPMDERRRHMETAHRIDILARTGIILLLPLGLHMGVLWGIVPGGVGWLTLMWVFFLGWIALNFAGFVHRHTDQGIRLNKIEEWMRFVMIPLLLILGISSLLGHGPFSAETGQVWFSTKVIVYALLLVMGLELRFIMREWTILFRKLDEMGDDETTEAKLERSIRIARGIAYAYWVGIAGLGFLGATKPF